MRTLLRLANVRDPGSLACRLRAKRFNLFLSLISDLEAPVRIVDLGGTVNFWETMGVAGDSSFHVTVVNIDPQDSSFSNIRFVEADATNLSMFHEDEFDVGFSNSAIEHLFSFENQKKMASEILRVAKSIWVQTPNYWFPVEPHFLCPFWQFMPVPVRAFIVSKMRVGQRGPYPSYEKALESVREIRLLSRRDLNRLFPSGEIFPEKFFLLNKSWIVVDGELKRFLNDLRL